MDEKSKGKNLHSPVIVISDPRDCDVSCLTSILLDFSTCI